LSSAVLVSLFQQLAMLAKNVCLLPSLVLVVEDDSVRKIIYFCNHSFVPASAATPAVAID